MLDNAGNLCYTLITVEESTSPKEKEDLKMYKLYLNNGWDCYEVEEFNNLEDLNKYVENNDDLDDEEYYEVWDENNERWLSSNEW